MIFRSKHLFAAAVLALAMLVSSGTVFAQEGPSVIINDQRHSEIQAFWTPERMRAAVDMDLQEAWAEPEGANTFEEEAESQQGAVPSYALGWRPGSGPQPDPREVFEVDTDDTTGGIEPLASAPFSPPGASTDYNNFSPYQRWAWFGRYRTYPTSVTGRLFATRPDGFVISCTATVISRRTIATAGQCLYTPGQGYNGSFLFCPSYNNVTGVNSALGCWSWSLGYASSGWRINASPDRDYGCLRLAASNSRTGQRVGNITGWAGRFYNSSQGSPDKDLIFAHGYATGAGFRGDIIVTCASPEWYLRNFRPGDGAYTKFIGCDQTGGAAGGGWFLNMRHPRGFETPPLDGSILTDPLQSNGFIFLHGVSSSRQPGFANELGSPQFRSQGSDTDDTDDVFRVCLAVD